MITDLEKETANYFDKLMKFKNSSFPILSVYLGSANKQVPSNNWLTTQFHSQVHQNLGGKEREYFKKDLVKIDNFIKKEFDSHGKRSLIIFTSGKNLWHVLSFEFSLVPLLVVSYSPYLSPILESFNKYKKYLVILADREKARLFIVHLGEMIDHKDIFNDSVPQNVKNGENRWDQQDKISRHIEDHIHRHLKFISEEIDHYVNNNPVSFLIIGGHKQMLPKIKKHLNYPLNKMVLGEFITELNLPLNEIFLKSKKIAQQINLNSEK